MKEKLDKNIVNHDSSERNGIEQMLHDEDRIVSLANACDLHVEMSVAIFFMILYDIAANDITIITWSLLPIFLVSAFISIYEYRQHKKLRHKNPSIHTD